MNNKLIPLMLTAGLFGQQICLASPFMVKDIDPVANSSPVHFIELNNQIIFQAGDSEHGVELWKTDATTAGTTLIKDMNPQGDSRPEYLTVVNNVLYFRAYDEVSGGELWRSDGTAVGTVNVKNINTWGSANVLYLTKVGNNLFFSADNGMQGTELWKSDGTEKGTIMVKDINRGDSNPMYLTDVNGTLFFQATTKEQGTELWKSDGTEKGTVLVKDINPKGNASLFNLTNVNGTLFFRADDGEHGSELWKSNGTEKGTVLVKDINSKGDANPHQFAVVNNILYFQANDGEHGIELWKSDGTEKGTVLVKDINPSGDSKPSYLTNFNGTLIFSADDGKNGVEVWKSDNLGTRMLAEINPNGHSYAAYFTQLNDVIFFRANDGVHGVQLWRTNGVDTTMISSGSDNLLPEHFFTYNGKLYFSALDNVHKRELWVHQHHLPTKPTDTPTATTAVLTINVQGKGSVKTSDGIIQCASDQTNCYHIYPVGTDISFTVTPDKETTFKGWTGDCQDNKVTLNSNKTCTAQFLVTHSVALGLPGSGRGSVVSNPSGIDCRAGGVCDYRFPEGSKITLTATPETGSKFSHWTSDCTSSNANITLTIDKGKACSAVFDKLPVEEEPNDGGEDHGCVDTNTRSADREEIDPCQPETMSGQINGLSARAYVGTAVEDHVFAGIQVQGDGGKPVIIRALGQSLNSENLYTELDPRIELRDFPSRALLDQNDNWPEHTSASQFNQLYQSPASMTDAALLVVLPNGLYTIEMSPVNTPGIGLVEIFEQGSTSNSQLMGISTRAYIGIEPENYLYAGLSITGTVKVLIRGIGLGLRQQQVDTNLDAHVTVRHFPEGTLVDDGDNENWQQHLSANELIELQQMPPDTTDAGMILSLTEGWYTIEVRPELNGYSGIGLVDIYQLDNTKQTI